jgi:hypothetical protein
MDRKTELAKIERQYREILKPTLESWRTHLDPVRNPVRVALLDAYMTRMEGAVYGSKIGDAAHNEVEEIEELAPWVNPSCYVDAATAHYGPVSEIMREIVNSDPASLNDTYMTIEQARKRNIGRPVNLLAIEALEMSLAGKSDNEIADDLCDYSMPPHKHNQARLPHKYGDNCSERFRKEIEKLRPLYEKYKPRN